MARLQPLSTLRTLLKAEVGASLTVGNADDAMFDLLLSSMQKWLATEYDWPILETRFDVNVVAGNRLLTFPVTLNTDRPIKVEVKYNLYWQPVLYGIGSAEYNEVDSERGIAQDPVMRWRYSDEGQFEIWPVPVTAQTIRFTGQRVLDTLEADTDTANLDDELIVLFCAAEYLSRHQLADAQLKLQKAQARLIKLRANFASRDVDCIFGGGSEESRKDRRNVPMIVVHG